MLKKLSRLFLTLFFCFSFTSVFSYDESEVHAQKGVLDLRQKDFSKNLKMKGEWLFYWKKLIDSTSTFPPDGRLVDFPLKWTDYKVNGNNLPSFGYATYMAKLLLPKDSSIYTVHIPPAYSSYKLFFNDRLVAQNGEVTSSPIGFIPHWQTMLVRIRPTTDTIIVTIQVANYAHSKGGFIDPLIIGKKEQIELKKDRDDAIILLLTGCLIMGGFFFLALFLVGRRDNATLFFALFSILYSYRIVGTESYVLHTLFPNISWYLTIRLEYISLFLSIGLFAQYTRFLFPFDVNKYIIHSVVIVCVSFSVVTIFFSPFYFTQLINPFLFVCLFCLIYTPYIYILAFKRKRPGSIYTITSTLVLLLIFSLTLFRYWRFIDYHQIINFITYIGFFFPPVTCSFPSCIIRIKKGKKRC